MSGPFPTSIPPFPGLTYLGSARITDFTASIGLPATPPAAASIAILTVEGGNVRWGTATVPPTATVGTPIWGTSFATLAKSMFASIRFINMTGSTSAMSIDYYG